MTNHHFTTWLTYILLGVVVYSFMPDKIKIPFLVVALIGGATMIGRQQGGNGLSDFTFTIFGKDLTNNI